MSGNGEMAPLLQILKFEQETKKSDGLRVVKRSFVSRNQSPDSRPVSDLAC